MKRSRLVAAGVVLAATTAMAGVSSAAPRPTGTASHGDVVLMHSADGVVVKAVKVISARELSVSIVPKALAREINVRVLLPVDYEPHSDEPYPVLYLFPGTSGHSSDWMTVGDAPKTTAPYRLITISSDI